MIDRAKKYNEMHDVFFQKVEIPFEDSKELLWDRLEEQLEKQPVNTANKKVVQFKWVQLVVAASIIILLGTTIFLRFYSQTLYCPKGERMAHILPDGSIVSLNAESMLKYHPYWWNFKREVQFKGEAFFEIEKGKHFSIISEQGMTEILGTSFNIFARNTEYEVYCKTGKVKVSSLAANLEYVIVPGELVQINTKLKQGAVISADDNLVLAWQHNSFNFTSVNLSKVFYELERQYNVQIQLKNDSIKGLKYTGYFTKGNAVESPLHLICRTFNLEFEKKTSSQYVIKPMRN